MEETRTEGAFELGCDRRRLDDVGLRLRVQHAFVGGEQQFHPLGAQLFAIGLERARVAVEILAGSELQAVHEDAGRHVLRAAAREMDERHVPRMQVAHGRDERQLADRPARGAQVRNRPYDAHQ